MATVKQYRCTTAHFQGDIFVPQGATLPRDNAQLIPEFFVAEEIEVPDPPKTKKTTT